MSNLLVQNIKHTNNTTAMTINTSGHVATDTIKGNTSAGSISVVGEGGSTTTNLQQGLCKAWGQATQDGGNTLRDSFNMSSMDDIGTGIIDYNFTNNMANDDFAGGSLGRKDSGGSDVFGRFSDMATDEFRLHWVNGQNGTLHDSDVASCCIFGDLA